MFGSAVEDRVGGLGWHGSGFPSGLLFRALFLPEKNLHDVQPDLASDYQFSDDNLTFTATMRDDVVWQDGEKVTADDVVWSINTVLKASQALSLFTNTFALIEGADAVVDGTAEEASGLVADGNTITLKLVEPVGDLLPALGQFLIYPKHLLEGSDPLQIHNDPFGQNPVGNGMYKVQELNVGNYIVLTPSETYEGTPPKIQEIVLIGSTDPVSDAKAGRLHLFNTNQPDVIRGMAEVTTFSAYPIDALFYRYFVINAVDNPVMQDVKVRKAILHAIDRTGLTQAIYGDVSAVINSGVPDTHPMHLDGLETYPFDPDLARQLLDEGGYDFNHTFRLRYYYGDDISRTFMTAIAQQLQDVGMKVEVLQFQGDATTELYEVRNYDLALKGLSAFNLRDWYAEYSWANFVQIIGEQPDMAEMIRQLEQTADESEQKSILAEMQKWEQENLWKLPLLTLSIYQYLSKSVSTPENPFSNPWWDYDMGFEEWEIQG